MQPLDPESARLLFAQQCDFVLAASEPKHFPDSKLPEVGLIGRSNVGKSSLINALTNRKNLARTSNTPGRTQQIIFFNLGQRLMLVDLPGYGHADAPHAEKDRWNELVHAFIQHRTPLRLMCLLVDSRHGLKVNDLEMMKFLDRAAISYQIVLTKSDQIKPLERDAKIAHAEAMLHKHPAARAKVLLTSSETGLGIPELRNLLGAFAEPEVQK